MMNKTAIKNFAIWARNKLIADICYRAGLMGITEKGIADPLPQSTLDAQFYDCLLYTSASACCAKRLSSSTISFSRRIFSASDLS